MVDFSQFAGDGGFRALELTKIAQNKGMDPISWAVQVSSTFSSVPVSLPSLELASILVSHICWGNNVPDAWKFLEKGIAMDVIPSAFVIALLSTRVISCRHSQPVAYRLYMEILKKYLFTMKFWKSGPTHHKMWKSIDIVMNLSSSYGSTEGEPGVIMVEFLFSTAQQLLTASLEDEGLSEVIKERNLKRTSNAQDMDLDGYDNYEEMKVDGNNILRKSNTATAVEVVALFLINKATSRIFYLVSQNMPDHWSEFRQRLTLLRVSSSTAMYSKFLPPEGIIEAVSDSSITCGPQSKILSLWKTRPTGASSSRPCLFHGASSSSSWLPFDIVLEDAMDGSLVTPTSAIEIITSLVRSLQAINCTSWHDTFLALWIAALRLVQRGRDSIEGPFPRLDTRLCMLLSVVVLVVAEIVGDEKVLVGEHGCGLSLGGGGGGQRRLDLASSLQVLGDYHGLLAPPQAVLSAANQAAAKAMMFISGIKVGTDYFECMISMDDFPLTCSGNLRHLIVEACIARKLLDTSAYFWAGYVNGKINPMHHGTSAQVPSWSSLMKGAPLSPLLVKALVSTPASSVAEVERIFEMALRGSEDEKIPAAVILCGASLVRGWNIQEHTTHFITRLLSPPTPADFAGGESHLINFAPMLNVLIVGIASVDCIHVFSLHGLVPHLASALMPICEVFGSCVPNMAWVGAAGEKLSAHVVFSNAFTLLLKLWRFNYPPIDHGLGTVPPIGSQLTPEYLLLIRNSHLKPPGDLQKDPQQHHGRLSAITSGASSSRPVFLDSFPRLKAWYRQHLACIASTLPGLAHGTVRRTVDGLLSQVFNKVGRGGPGHGIGSTNSASSGSAGHGNEDGCPVPDLPAWDILEAIPFVVDSALTACAHGQLCPRELATGLKGLADLLPASLASIASYFSAEVTRGVWRPAFMNGTDWPSPAANLSNVEDQIKKILAATGVDVPSLVSGGNSPATLPLPLAAFVSLTITYKIDRASEHFLTLAGPALESLAAGCPWPCMPIVASLWTQKAKRWSDFLVFSASSTVFLHSGHAVVQLLQSCFSAALSPSSGDSGVGPLLGHGLGRGGTSPAAPGFLYLRVYRSIRDGVLVAEEVVSILIRSVRDTTSPRPSGGAGRRRYGRVSLAGAAGRVELAASLGASLVWLSGGAGVVQSLVKETLPTWFICSERTELGRLPGEAASTLAGHALAHFVVLCVAFAWGVGPTTSSSRRRAEVLRAHTEFLAAAMDRVVTVGCSRASWRAYVTGFLGLMTGCLPAWPADLDPAVIGRLGRGLSRWGEDRLAVALLVTGGFRSMGTAAEIIVEGAA